MKKTMLFLIFAASGYLATAQDYTKVNTLYTLKKYEDAQKELDKIASSDKGKDKAETYLYGAAINSELFRDSTLSAQYPDAGDSAYQDLQMYVQKDSSLKTLKSTTTLNSLAWLYSASFNEGKKFFSQSNWPLAFKNFKRAVDMSEFLNKNGFNSNKVSIDTFTVLYAGYSAQNMAKPEEAVKYYEKLADLKNG